MVPLLSLWLPVLLSAAAVFVVSGTIHMVLTYHRADFGKLPDEDGILEALRRFQLPPGDYMLPNGGGPEAMKDPVFIEKMKRGPVALITVMPNGAPAIGGSLVQWFAFCVLASIFAAYVTGLALGPGADYMATFRIAGTIAFAAYALAEIPVSIWYKRKWGTTLKNLFDGLVYALVTAGFFGWLWPAA